MSTSSIGPVGLPKPRRIFVTWASISRAVLASRKRFLIVRTRTSHIPPEPSVPVETAFPPVLNAPRISERHSEIASLLPGATQQEPSASYLESSGIRQSGERCGLPAYV